MPVETTQALQPLAPVVAAALERLAQMEPQRFQETAVREQQTALQDRQLLALAAVEVVAPFRVRLLVLVELVAVVQEVLHQQREQRVLPTLAAVVEVLVLALLYLAATAAAA
jgi:hypothetical protein